MLYTCKECGKPTDNILEWDSEITKKHYTYSRCDECAKLEEEKEEWQNERFRENTIICPWCEHEYDSYDCIYEEGTENIKCDYCGNEIEVETTNLGYVWTTRKPEKLFNLKEREINGFLE